MHAERAHLYVDPNTLYLGLYRESSRFKQYSHNKNNINFEKKKKLKSVKFFFLLNNLNSKYV